MIGPLVNPMRPSAQVLGVAKQELLDPMAEALRILGLKRAVVVHGAGGLDEASLEGKNEIRTLEGGQISKSFIDPCELGLQSALVASLKGGDILENQEILSSVLKGGGTQSQTEVVALNTGLVLWAAGIQNDFVKGLETAQSCMKQGLAWDRFEIMRDALNEDQIG